VFDALRCLTVPLFQSVTLTQQLPKVLIQARTWASGMSDASIHIYEREMRPGMGVGQQIQDDSGGRVTRECSVFHTEMSWGGG
jgi:hypothetical protein